MRVGRKAVLALAFVIAPLGAATGGCVSDDSAAPSPAHDAAVPSPDGTVPVFDAGADQASPRADAGDATVPTSDAGDATAPLADAADAAAPDAPILDAADAADAADAPAPDADVGTTAFVRVAWLRDATVATVRGRRPAAPILPDRYDVCVAPHGTGAWSGPVLAAQGSPGLDAFDVTRRFAIVAGQYDVRVVLVPADPDAGPPTCAALDADPDGGSPSDFTDLPALAAGTAITLVFTAPSLSGVPTAMASLVSLVDETTTTAGKVKIRFANVASDPTPLDYGLGGGAAFTRLFTADPVAHLDPGADPHGYVEVDPFTQIDTSIKHGESDLGATASLDAVAGTIVSVFAADAIGGTLPLACFDGQVSAKSPLLTACADATTFSSDFPPAPLTRFANFIADPGPAVDLCVKYRSQPTFAVPIGAAEPDGGVGSIPYGTVSERYGLHTGFTYDVRLVAGGAVTCTAPVAPDTTYTPPSSAVPGVTLAFTGYLTPPADAGVAPSDAGSDAGGALGSVAFAAVPIHDLECGEGPPVVRVVNLAAPLARPLTVSVSGGWSVPNVPYGGFVAVAPDDACGFQPVTPQNGGVLFAGGNLWGFTSTEGTLDTLYVFGAGLVLDCRDDDSSASACTLLPPGG